eukprot:COSAG01_NODE_7889_length_3004_cov_25.369363_1_plen_70_part_10
MEQIVSIPSMMRGLSVGRVLAIPHPLATCAPCSGTCEPIENLLLRFWTLPFSDRFARTAQHSDCVKAQTR